MFFIIRVSADYCLFGSLKKRLAVVNCCWLLLIVVGNGDSWVFFFFIYTPSLVNINNNTKKKSTRKMEELNTLLDPSNGYSNYWNFLSIKPSICIPFFAPQVTRGGKGEREKGQVRVIRDLFFHFFHH